MKTVQILEDHDQILATDWVRTLEGDGEINSTSCYSGSPQNNALWVKVTEVFGEWMLGYTVKELHDRLNRDIFTNRYEFVRGDVPRTHEWRY